LRWLFPAKAITFLLVVHSSGVSFMEECFARSKGVAILTASFITTDSGFCYNSSWISAAKGSAVVIWDTDSLLS